MINFFKNLRNISNFCVTVFFHKKLKVTVEAKIRNLMEIIQLLRTLAEN